MEEQERAIREEIATKMIQETIMSLARIAHWVGLPLEDVQQLSRKVGRGRKITWPSAT